MSYGGGGYLVLDGISGERNLGFYLEGMLSWHIFGINIYLMRVILDLEETILNKLSERAVIEKRSRKNLMEFILENSVTQKDYSNKIEDLKFAKNQETDRLKLTKVDLEAPVYYTTAQPEHYNGEKLSPYAIDEMGMTGYEPIKDYAYYEKKGKSVGFEEAEDLIREILNSNLKNWQKPMLQKMINSRFF